MAFKNFRCHLLELPLDLIFYICKYLDIRSFLTLCSSCSTLHDRTISQNAAYWRYRCQNTFRVPSIPVVDNDGMHWKRLYRRLLTQTLVYTWGSNDFGCLAHPSYLEPACYFPSEWQRPAWVVSPYNASAFLRFGVIADLQCGGWCTVVLNDRGELYISGVINSKFRTESLTPVSTDPRPLNFPWSFTRPGEGSSVWTAIKQVSCGRSHILGLSDSGSIWSWFNESKPAIRIRFYQFEIVESTTDNGLFASPSTYGSVKKVVGGWSKSSALIVGVGIVVWEIAELDHPDASDSIVVVPCKIIKNTIASRLSARSSLPTPAPLITQILDTIGEVVNFIHLEHYIVFITDLGKIFAAKLSDKSSTDSNIDRILELPMLSTTSSTSSEPPETCAAKQLHGTFRSIGVILKNRQVIIADQNLLDYYWDLEFDNTNITAIVNTSKPPPAVEWPPSLQAKNVISLAFGDYHYHALHSNGTITSHGIESQCRGQFGLGNHRATGVLRGLLAPDFPFQNDIVLSPDARKKGRVIWFDEMRDSWLKFLRDGGHEKPDMVYFELDGTVRKCQISSDNRVILRGRQACTRLNFDIAQNQKLIDDLSEWIEKCGAQFEKWSLHQSLISMQNQSPNSFHFHSDSHSHSDEESDSEHLTWPSLDPSKGDRKHSKHTWHSDESKEDVDGTSAHFAMAVSAAGWHSGALVLVNQKELDMTRMQSVIHYSHPPTPSHPPGHHKETQSGLSSLSSSFANLASFFQLSTVSPQYSFRKKPERMIWERDLFPLSIEVQLPPLDKLNRNNHTKTEHENELNASGSSSTSSHVEEGSEPRGTSNPQHHRTADLRMAPIISWTLADMPDWMRTPDCDLDLRLHRRNV